MPKVYRLSKAGLRIFYKVRHRKGHGIHSPFVFSLIIKVIEEKAEYYAYGDIKEIISLYPQIKIKPDKSNLLSFKLVNYFNAKKILEIGTGSGINTLYLTAPSSQIECISVETSENKYHVTDLLFQHWYRKINICNTLPQTTDKQDCICVDLRNYSGELDSLADYLLNKVNDESFIIIKGIRTKRRHQALWKNLRESKRVTVSLDLFHEGVLFFNPKLYKRNYKISF